MSKRDDKDSTPVPKEWANFSDNDDYKEKNNDWTHFSESELSANEASSGCLSESTKTDDVWEMTPEQFCYYVEQFRSLQPILSGLIPGIQAKNFFEMSQLPREDLCKVWELSDIDCDGNLSLAEFCIAMHLVVLKKNTIPIPNELPNYLANVAHSVEMKSLTEFNMNDKLNKKDEFSSKNVSESGKVNVTAVATATTTAGSLPQATTLTQGRGGSVSSQSDISSISEGVLAFDTRLPPGAVITHPVAVRPLSGTNFEDSDTVPLNMYADDISNQFDTSNSFKTSPPTPPPRNTFKDPMVLPPGDYLYNNEFPGETNEHNELDAVKRRCDELVKENMSLSKRLMALQEKRIYLEIVLENGMPLTGL